MIASWSWSAKSTIQKQISCARLRESGCLQRLPSCSPWRILLALQRAEPWEHTPRACTCQRPVRRQRSSEAHLKGRRRDANSRLLVGSAHYILGPFARDSDLRRHGEKIASRGGKNAKKRAAVAVARKLSVLLHRLWVSGEVYDPLYNTHTRQEQEEEAA
jgi:hypothetical protein